jgi:hypothetical protein
MTRFAGWLLAEDDRAALLRAVPPAYPNVVAHHVTLRPDPPEGLPPPAETEGVAVGVADDGAGVQALVVEIGGTTDRPGGGTYHVTWSLADGRRAVESNDVIREQGWTRLATRHHVRMEPGIFD